MNDTDKKMKLAIKNGWTKQSKALAHLKDAEMLLNDLQKEFRGDDWSSVAHSAVTRALEKVEGAVYYMGQVPQMPDAKKEEE